MANTTTDTLEALGLSPNEAKIYEALVERGESSVSSLAVTAKVHRRNAYDALERLIDKGLCFQIASTGENRYNAVSPENLRSLVEDRKDKLEKILPSLNRKFTSRVPAEEAYIYRGIEGQKNVWRDVLATGENSYFIGAKNAWSDPRLSEHRAEFFKGANRKKITFIQLFAHELKQKRPDFVKEFPGQLKYRFLPKEYPTDSAIHVFGDYVITYHGLFVDKLADGVVFFVIRSKRLADDYRTWFRYMWEQCPSQEKGKG